MKRIFFICLVIFMFMLVGCKEKNNPTEAKTKEPSEETVVSTGKTKEETTPVEPTVPTEKTKEETTPIETTPVDDPDYVTLTFVTYISNTEIDEYLKDIVVRYDEECELPLLEFDGYVFGWKADIDGKVYTKYPGYSTNYGKIVYTQWENEKLDLEEFFNEHFGPLDDKSEVYLEDSFDGIDLEWDIPELDLITVNDNTLKVNKKYQSHHLDRFNVTLTATYENGYSESFTDRVLVTPIVFHSLGDTPIGTYLSVGALSSYRASSERYKKEKTLFGEKAKSVLDICYYAFIIINSDATCFLGNSEVVDEILELRNSDIRIIGSIAGTSLNDSQLFAKFTSDPDLLQKFVWNLANLMERYHFDGLDIDWESTAGQYVVASGMTNLCKALRVELDSRQHYSGSKYLLTAAVPASSWGTGSDRYDFTELNKYLDIINLMSYDANNSSVCSHIDPLYKSSYDNGYGFGCDYGVKLLEGKGFPATKIMMGVAGYGKAYKVSSVVTNHGYPMLGSSGTLTQIAGVPDSYATGTLFNSAIAILLKNSNYISKTEYNSDGQIVGAYLYSEKDLMFVTYESPELIKEKYNYAKKRYGLGLMEWCYCEDTADWYVDTLYEMMYNN